MSLILEISRPGMGVHTCNSNTLGGGGGPPWDQEFETSLANVVVSKSCLLKMQKLAGCGGRCLQSQLLGRLRQENRLNVGDGGCSEQRLPHCTPARRLRRADYLRSGVWDQPDQHGETPSLLKNNKISQVWWRMPITAANQEAEAGESLEPRRWRLQWAEMPLHSSLGDRARFHLKNKTNNKTHTHTHTHTHNHY